MIISILAAVDEGGGIGFENRLPWHLGADLRNFKNLTLGHHILMGRRTFESIGRALPGRTTVIISRTLSDCPLGAYAVRSLEDGLALAKSRGETEAYVIGGAQIFARALPLAGRLYLTRVHAKAQADVFFPPIDESEWLVLSESYQPADENNDYAFTFLMLERHAVNGWGLTTDGERMGTDEDNGWGLTTDGERMGTDYANGWGADGNG